MKAKITLSISVFVFITIVLSVVQLKLDHPLILVERFVKGGGWFEIFVISFYGAIIAWNMHDKTKVTKWRRNTWLFFSVVFFAQLLIGIFGHEKFLMTGKLHLPVPMMILAGPIYRFQLSFMTILFLSTVLLTGPAWCSHLCYFGAFDGYMSFQKSKAKPLNKIQQFKLPILVIVILSAIVLRTINISPIYATILAGTFGVVGVIIILFISGKKGKMVQCSVYCPIGTIVNYLRFINPFRLKINNACDSCMRCTVACKYNALDKNTIDKKNPGITCTLCGDCLSTCHANAFEYRFFKMKGEKTRNLYLFLTISIHAIFLALARI